MVRFLISIKSVILREKERDLIQCYCKSPYTIRKSKKQCDNINTPPKTSITQRLRTDLGRSVGVTEVTPPVLINRFMSVQTSVLNGILLIRDMSILMKFFRKYFNKLY